MGAEEPFFFFDLAPEPADASGSGCTPVIVAERCSQSNQIAVAPSNNRPRIVALKLVPCCPPKGNIETNSGWAGATARSASHKGAASNAIQTIRRIGMPPILSRLRTECAAQRDLAAGS